MATDLSIITWDSEDGFKAKTHFEIFNMLVTRYKEIYGKDLNLAPTSPEGTIIEMFASFFAEFSSLTYDFFMSFDIGNARGDLLNNLLLMSHNMIRNVANTTSGSIVISFSGDPITFTSNDLLTFTDNNFIEWRIITTSPLTSGDTVQYENITPGDVEVGASIINIKKNSTIEKDTGITFTGLTLERLGSFDETDEEFKARRQRMFGLTSSTIIDAIKVDLLRKNQNITDVAIINSNHATDTEIDFDAYNDGGESPYYDTTLITIPVHDCLIFIKLNDPAIELTVASQQTESILTEIRNKLPLGIHTYIDTSGTLIGYLELDLLASDASTVTEKTSVIVSGPRYIDQINILVTPLDGFDSPEVAARIKPAVIEHYLNYRINQPITSASLYEICRTSGNIDANNPTFIINSITINSDTYVDQTYIPTNYAYAYADDSITIDITEMS